MIKKGARQTFFVCAAISGSNELISKVIEASYQKDAALLFTEQFGVTAKYIHGPFFKKRAQVIENTRTLKFSDQQKKCIYNDWEVNALILKEPEDHAYLVFIKRLDGKKLPAPKGTVVVPISDLRFYNVE